MRLGAVLALLALAGCGDWGNLSGPAFDPGAIRLTPRSCSQMMASDAGLHWQIGGFQASDILNGDVPNPPQPQQLIAGMRVGQAKSLRIVAATVLTSEDCASKVATVEWQLSNPAVARLEVSGEPRAATLVALQPGDSVLSANLTFRDGSPPLRVLPWSFANFGSGDVTVVRVTAVQSQQFLNSNVFGPGTVRAGQGEGVPSCRGSLASCT